jgi:putative endonuclease
MPEFPAIAAPGPIPGQCHVYVLLCADGSYYVGQSNNVPERVRKHRYGLGSKHTAENRFARLIYTEGPYTIDVAVSREAQLKRWTRAKKEALIRRALTRLHELSRSRD